MRHFLVFSLFFYLPFLVLTLADAWSCVPHMIIAQIAKSAMSPDTVASVESIISKFYSSETEPFPYSPDMVQAACWADDIRETRLTSMAGWHFIDNPFSPDNTSIPENFVQKENVATVIPQMVDAIEGEVERRSKAGLENLKDIKDNWITSFALLYLLHLYGDIHQPLHVTDRFTKEFPEGDRGGNLIKVYFNNKHLPLHSFWDQACGVYSNDKEFERPLSADKIQYLKQQASFLVEKYNFSTSQKEMRNTTVMAKEGFNLSVNFVYEGIEDGTRLTQEYIGKCTTIALERITLAGWRLGNELEYLFNQKKIGIKILDSLEGKKAKKYLGKLKSTFKWLHLEKISGFRHTRHRKMRHNN